MTASVFTLPVTLPATTSCMVAAALPEVEAGTAASPAAGTAVIQRTPGTVRLLGRLLALRRERLGMTQTEVARRMGLANPNMISMIEAGRSKVPPLRAAEFAEIYGLKPWAVLRRSLVEARPDIEEHLPA